MVVSAISLGAWQWGTGYYWGYDRLIDKNEIIRAKEKAIELGVNFIDTAEVYGWGKSEKIIGEIVRKEDGIFVATKFFPFRLTPDAVFRAVDKSLKRLKRGIIDLYQVHFPNPAQSVSRLMRNMERLIKLGRIRYIGVSNYNIKWLQRAQEALSFSDIVSNQIHYSLIYRKPEEGGLLKYCRENEIGIIAYSPLEQGLLTGKYNERAKPTGLRRIKPAFFGRHLVKLKPLNITLESIGSKHSRTAAQVALNWVIRDTNIIAIPGAKNAYQVELNCHAVDLDLTDEELDQLERAYRKYAV